MTSYPELEREYLIAALFSIDETVALIGKDLKLQFVNRPAREGYTAEDIRGAPALDFVPPEEREVQRGRLLHVLETGEKVTFEIPVKSADGGVEWHEGTLTPIEHEGRVVGMVSVTINITDRHLAEQEAEKLRRLVPLCSWCGKIRSDEGYWREIESYIEEHSDARVTHGICTDCEGTLEGNGTDGPA